MSRRRAGLGPPPARSRCPRGAPWLRHELLGFTRAEAGLVCSAVVILRPAHSCSFLLSTGALVGPLCAWYSASASAESTPQAGVVGDELGRHLDPEAERSTEPRPVIFIFPNPGSEPIACAGRPRRPPRSGCARRPAPPPRRPRQFLPRLAIAGSGGSQAARGTRPRTLRIHRGDAGGVERADPLLQPERPLERLLNGHLLVDRARSERERIGRDELVRLVRVGEVERLGHASSVDLGGTLGKWTRSTSSRRTWFERALPIPPAQALGSRRSRRAARAHPGADRLREGARGVPDRDRPAERVAG